MQLKADKIYTETEYEKIDNNGLVEFDDGKIILMSPPSTIHQEIVGFLYRTIANFLDGKSCRAFISPFNVKLTLENNSIKRVEPDISVICDKSKITPNGCEGAPDFIIEVVSSGNRMHDYVSKANWYRQAGVKEYWIVDYEKNVILVYVFQQDEVFEFNFMDKIPVFVLGSEFSIDFKLLDFFMN